MCVCARASLVFLCGDGALIVKGESDAEKIKVGVQQPGGKVVVSRCGSVVFTFTSTQSLTESEPASTKGSALAHSPPTRTHTVAQILPCETSTHLAPTLPSAEVTATKKRRKLKGQPVSASQRSINNEENFVVVVLGSASSSACVCVWLSAGLSLFRLSSSAGAPSAASLFVDPFPKSCRRIRRCTRRGCGGRNILPSP